MKNNIFFFTWENTIFLKKDLDRWVSRFTEKYSEFNISRIDKDIIEKINIEQELTTPPFLSEHRLIILNNIPSPASKRDSDEEETLKDNSVDIRIEKVLDNIPDANFVIFISQEPDVKKPLYKRLLELATVKEFKNLNEHWIKEYIRNELLWIDNAAISKLIQYKWLDLSKIESEIWKLSLYRANDRITEDDIEKNVLPEIDVSVFQFLDRLYELNFNKALVNLKRILENDKIEPTFAAIMSNMRKLIYILYLRRNGIADKIIIDQLKVHSFVFQKTLSSAKNESVIYRFYEKMCELDLKSKTWELVLDGEDGLIMAIEKVIFDLKNTKNTV